MSVPCSVTPFPLAAMAVVNVDQMHDPLKY